MAEYFKGYGGAMKSESVIKIQHGDELKTGKLQVHQIGDAHSQDVTSGKQSLGSYEKGDLPPRDLGYLDLKSFGTLSRDNGAAFISRLKPKTTIFELTPSGADMLSVPFLPTGVDVHFNGSVLANLYINVTIL